MDALSFWLTWWVFWGGTAAALVGIFVGIVAIDRVKITSTLSTKHYGYKIAGAVYSAYKISDKIFGEKLLSWKAFRRSILVSSIGTTLAFAIALATTPPLLGFLYSGVRYNITYGDMSERASATSSFLMLIFNVVAEYLYVMKSRIILKKIQKSMNVWMVVFIYVADVSSTIMLFLILTPMIISVFMEAFEFCLYYKEIIYNISGTSFMIEFGNDIDNKYVYNVSVYKQIYMMYENVLIYMFNDIFSAVREWFQKYHTMKFYAVMSVDTSVNSAICPKDGCPIISIVQPVLYFTTTALASAYVTTIWVSIYAVMIIVGNLLLRQFRFTRATLLWIHDDPSIILRTLIPASALFFFVSGKLIVWLFSLR